MFAIPTKTLGAWALAALPFMMLSGCATTESVSEQTGPLSERIDALGTRLDGGLSQAIKAAEDARQQALLAQTANTELAQEVEDKFADLDERLADLEQSDSEHDQQLDTLDALVRSLQRNLAEDTAREASRQITLAEPRIIAAAAAQAEARAKPQADALTSRMDQLEKRLAEVARMAEEALAALGLGPRKIYGKVVHSVTLTDDKTLFPINSPELGEKDIAKLKAVADYVQKLDVNYHIGIHGHTDGLGSDDYNYALGKARAEVVKNHLHEKLGIPLLRMSVISHGAMDVNSYREGANRRIVVEVLQ